MDKIGVITKPQGVKGEFRVSLDIPNRTPLKKLEEVTINNITYPVERVIFRDGFVVFKLDGIFDRNVVETLRGASIYGNLDYGLKSNEILISDIIGFEVFSDNISLGVLVSVEDYGAGEIFVVKGKVETMFPNVNNVIKSINTRNNTIVLDKNVLDTVKVENK